MTSFACDYRVHGSRRSFLCPGKALHLAKDGVLPVEPVARAESHEKLAVVIVLAAVGHGDNTSHLWVLVSAPSVS